MASKPVTLQVKPRGKPIRSLPKETRIYIQGSTADLYHRLAAESNFSIHRLRITKSSDGTGIPNEKTTTVASMGLRDGDVIQVKDLGPQIAWRTVFILEYLGPLLIHPLLYKLQPYLYPKTYTSPSPLQTLSLLLITLHFLKRELETLFIHRFSLATMPWTNLPKNSAHYWLFGGLLIAWETYRPTSRAATAPANSWLTYPALLCYLLGEVGNFQCHRILRGLRSEGGAERGVPQGWGFGVVTCPNYGFEALAWVGVLLVTRSWATAGFVVLAVGQMAVWARKKEMRYRKEGGAGYRRKRFFMVPGVY